MKKIILSILASLVLLFSFAPAAYAQSTWYDQSFQDWLTKVYDTSNPSEIFGERYTAAQVQWILYSLAANVILLPKRMVSCFLSGNITDSNCVNDFKFLIDIEKINNNTGSTNNPNFAPAIFSERPLSGISYFRDIARNWHLIPEAKAQAGFGFTALSPILNLWRVVRNIAYSLTVLAILAIAFMIMFRVKISPQTVITVQSAIPKIAIALLLITFSYAIAGFMVDLVYVLIGLISLIIANSKMLTFTTPQVFDILTNGYFGLGGFGLLIAYGGGFSLVLVATIFSFLKTLGNVGGGIVAAIAGPLIFIGLLILAIVFLFAAIKLLWTLLKTFVNVLLLVIFAPLQIALGIVSSTAGFGSWLKSLAANLAVYPVVGALFMVALIFLKGALSLARPELFGQTLTAGSEVFSQGSWSPPLTLGASVGGGALLWLLASLVVILIIPKTVDVIQSFIQGKPFGYGTAIGEAFGPAAGIGRAAGLYGAGQAIQYREGVAYKAGEPPPVWTQVARTLLKLQGRPPGR